VMLFRFSNDSTKKIPKSSLSTDLLEVLTVHNTVLTHAPRGQQVRQDNSAFTLCNCVSTEQWKLSAFASGRAGECFKFKHHNLSCQNLTTSYFPRSIRRSSAIVLSIRHSASCSVAEAGAVMCPCHAVAICPARRYL